MKVLIKNQIITIYPSCNLYNIIIILYYLKKILLTNIYNKFKTTIHKNYLVNKFNRGLLINKQVSVIYKIPPNFLILNLYKFTK